ncbi:helix-turn-helix domain-containing protein [Kineosporia succinea]|uniref:Transcriptional regulator with XRE-family HTH domain n=1 Tax=Kineosporia succinea TaxID=84632 RepID=A0ABT9PAM9_9ACTN|nr:helix-turn-helix transcriptional regulator [Kineosporia succinea]MDP9829606.1 transcriptional regulator with XRE-family HTH domain [Kineosporia succinea]
MSAATFGDLVRQWRDRLDPADAGFIRTTKSRAPGLRREELATVAGLSVEYVLRLEQGRATNPSAQVVAALARALQLRRFERDQLFRSAGLLPPQDGLVDSHVPPGVTRLAARLGDVPIGIFAADWRLLWWNDMWIALHGDPTGIPETERTVGHMLFGTGPAAAYLRPLRSPAGPDAFAATIVADLKDATARYPADGQLATLVSGFRQSSPLFERLWAAVGASTLAGEEKTVGHPDVGDITLDCDVLTVPGADLRIVTYTAAAGSAGAGRLDWLRVTRGQSLDAAGARNEGVYRQGSA